MMRVKKRPILLTLIILLILFVIVFISIPTKSALIFYERNTDTISAYLPIESGETFQIIFTHSIHLTDVVEKYIITKDNKIKQYEFIFEEFGIGMPSNAETDEEFVYEDGKYHIKNMNNIFSSMKIRNGKTVSEHRLVWEKNGIKHQVYFNNYFEPGDWFTVKIEKISLIESWKEVKIRD
ncbi:DUF1850 domain-containing protein [Pseudogracilibacillus sp. SE30717A]|uniref:DUF1850 domain-containing protein n=1 Tax=Pseudogracilibacillus sp. SE30717A TaxID=3098293 RepID=UPI00300DEE36